MSPKFHDSDHVLIRQHPTVELGQIGIFYVNGKGYILISKKSTENAFIFLTLYFPLS
ncbi:MAG: hypothetical protein HFJ89_00015 [Oscillospiraceae bacterium]|nr:hypothetical protein [Oscillospiraceae bacterium]